MPEELPSPELLAEAAAYGVLLPGVISGLLLFLTIPVSRRPGPVRAAGAMAFAAGFLTGYVVLCKVSFDKPILQFADEWQWLPVWATVAVAADLLDLAIPRRRRAACTLRLLTILAVVFVAADYLVPRTAARTPGDAPMAEVRPYFLHAFRLVLLVPWLATAWAADRVPGVLFPLLLALPALAGGMVLEFGGSGSYAQLAGLLAGVLLGCAPLSWWKPDRSFVRGMVPGIAVVLPGLMLNGYSDSFVPVPPACYLLVTLAPLTLLVGTLPRVQRFQVLRRWAMLAFAMLLPLGVAVGLTLTVPK